MLGGKLIILLIVLLLMGGTLSYDRYMVEKGEMSPVGQFIDFAGLSKYIQRDRKINSERETLHENMDQHLLTMSQQFDQIEQKRKEFVGNRQKLLGQIALINHDIGKEALAHHKILIEEQEQFQKKTAELREWEQSVMALSEEPDPEVRYNRFVELKQELLVKLGMTEEEAKVALGPLMLMFSDLETLIAAQPQEILEDCEELDFCLKEEIQQIHDGLEQALGVEEPLIDESEEAVITRSNQLNREYVVYIENMEATDHQIEEAQKEVELRLKDLSMNILSASDEAFIELMGLYAKLMKTHQILLTNLELNQKRFLESAELLREQLEQTNQQKSVMNGSADQSLQAMNKLFKQVDAADQDIYELYGDRWKENILLSKKLGAAIGFNYEKKGAPQEFSDQPAFIPSITSASIQKESARPELKPVQAGRQRQQQSQQAARPIHQNVSQTNQQQSSNNRQKMDDMKRKAREQYQKVKQKARDQGF